MKIQKALHIYLINWLYTDTLMPSFRYIMADNQTTRFYCIGVDKFIKLVEQDRATIIIDHAYKFNEVCLVSVKFSILRYCVDHYPKKFRTITLRYSRVLIPSVFYPAASEMVNTYHHTQLKNKIRLK